MILAEDSDATVTKPDGNQTNDYDLASNVSITNHTSQTDRNVVFWEDRQQATSDEADDTTSNRESMRRGVW